MCECVYVMRVHVHVCACVWFFFFRFLSEFTRFHQDVSSLINLQMTESLSPVTNFQLKNDNILQRKEEEKQKKKQNSLAH